MPMPWLVSAIMPYMTAVLSKSMAQIKTVVPIAVVKVPNSRAGKVWRGLLGICRDFRSSSRLFPLFSS